MTLQDRKIARDIEESGKGCVVIFNKWDLVKGTRMEHCENSFFETVSFLKHCPVLFVSALTGRNVFLITDAIKQVRKAQLERIGTGELNQFIQKAIEAYHPPMIEGKRLKIYYMTQISIGPPTFVLFINYPNLMLDTYKKYLMHKFRERYQFTGTPLLFFLRGKQRKGIETSQRSDVA